MLLLLEFSQPFYHGGYTACGRILQTHGEQAVVYFEQRLLVGRAIGGTGGSGELDAGEREQRRVGLPCKERDHARRLLERKESTNCIYMYIKTGENEARLERQLEEVA
jgi:hypothetical protein